MWNCMRNAYLTNFLTFGSSLWHGKRICRVDKDRIVVVDICNIDD